MDNEKNHDYWQSYSDLMAAVLLVFVLLITMMMFKYNGMAAELKEQKSKVDELIGVRAMIVERLLEEFEATKMSLDIDPQSGAIRFSEGVFFDTAKSILKPEGKEYLNEFLPRYLDVLLNPKYKDFVSQIIIEGHTDNRGTYMYNLDLSQKRAFAVASYILLGDIPGIDRDTKQDLQVLLTANGRSYSQPIYNSKKIDLDKSRRVEFKFRLKDEEMINEMQKILEGKNKK